MAREMTDDKGKNCVGCNRGTNNKVLDVSVCAHCEPLLVLRRDEIKRAFRELLR